MNTWIRLKTSFVANRDLALELIRIYLGLGLFAKGVYFASHLGVLMSMLSDEFAVYTVAHLIAFAYLAGGLLLAAGLLTRLAAAVQAPIVAGAVLTVHLREGLFGASQNLEFALLVLFLLVISVVVGGGRWSADYFLAKREALLLGKPFSGIA